MAKPTKHYKGWRIRWTDADGERHSEVYAKYDDAAFKLKEHEHQVAEVIRGLRLPDPPPRTFDEIAEYWMKTRGAAKRSRVHDESILRAHLRPAFSGKLLTAITKVELDEFCASKLHLHPNTRQHILTLLVSLFRLALDLGWVRVLPKIKKPRIKLFSKDFSYLRTGEEIARFLRAAREEGELEYVLYSTAIYTGMRQGELAGLRWSEVDLEKRLIIVAHSWDGPPKNGEDRPVPIVDALLPVLAAWRLRSRGTLVFPNRDGGMFSKCARIFQEALHSTLDRAGFPKVERNGRMRRYIRFHDLRHSFASHWMMSGGDFFKLQQVLGHASPQMTMRYAHFAPSTFAADYSRFGPAMPDGVATIIPLPGVMDTP